MFCGGKKVGERTRNGSSSGDLVSSAWKGFKGNQYHRSLTYSDGSDSPSLNDYLKFLAETKLLADEMGEDHIWSEISFREATEQDKERIKSALDSEGSFPGNAGWAAKRGANLSCSANLSQYTSADVTPSKSSRSHTICSADVTPSKSSRSHTICLSSKRTKATLKTKRLAYIEPTSRGKSPVAEEFVKAPKDQCIIVYKRTYKNKQ